MSDVKKLQEERIKLFHDVDNRIISKRVPVNVNLSLMFEYGDPKEIKAKLGHKHIITGLYPFSYMKTHTKRSLWI